MAKITISSVSIENLGPFRERQVLDFSVVSGKPVILVKALNGSGKTTLLTALQIGLYGQKALPGLRKAEYEQLILGLQRQDAKGRAATEVGVVAEINGDRHNLLVRREWSVQGDKLYEDVVVYENDSMDIDFSQNWDEFIGNILPAELVQLFLFDGEKIEALANPERLPDLLKRATEVFLGIGGIDALSNDLKAVERRAALKNKSQSDAYQTALSSFNSWDVQATELENRIERLTQEVAATRNEAEQAQAEFDKYSNDAKKKGLEAYEKAAAIRNNVMAARQAEQVARVNLAAAMSDPVLPIAWLPQLWSKYQEVWTQNQHARHAKTLSDEFKKHDGRVLAALKAKLPDGELKALKAAMADDIKAFSSTQTREVKGFKDVAPQDVERQLEFGRLSVERELASVREAQKALEKAEQHMGQIPAEEQIGDILAEIQKRSKYVSSVEAKLATLTQSLVEAQGNLAHVSVRLNAAKDRLATEFQDQSLEAKSLAASLRARNTLIKFKERLLAAKANWLSEKITAEFGKLLRKRNLIKEVVVDPTTYQVTIKDAKQHELPMDRLSAGERQLLAISVLSALISERKGRFPVVVDTPLARLDNKHRSSLIKEFFAHVSHQVVVLSTDQEVEGTAYEALEPFTNAEYSLEFDDSERRTVVQRLAKVVQ